MTRERINQAQSDLPTSSTTDSGNAGPTRDYRQDAEASNDKLNESLHSLAQMFAPRDIVNRGAQ